MVSTCMRELLVVRLMAERMDTCGLELSLWKLSLWKLSLWKLSLWISRAAFWRRSFRSTARRRAFEDTALLRIE